jgi:PadR family transcriptional regulator, regulatory protein AphA
MSLEHILLGMLRKPATGYALKREFEQGARHFWSAELSQIYPALERMERRRWLKSKQQPSPVGPARRVYQRTAAGERELFAWLKSGPVMGTERFAYLGQLVFFGELDDLSQTTSFMRQLRERLAGTLDFLEQAAAPLEEQRLQNPRKLSAIEFHELLALRMGVLSLRAKVRWCDESLEMIDSRVARSPQHD